MSNTLLEQWLKGLRIAHIAHHYAASHNSKMHKAFGIPSVMVSTIVGTSVFASLGQQEHSHSAIILTGLLSLAAAVLSTLQTFLSFSANAEKHKISATKYGVLRRELELFMQEQELTPDQFRDFTQALRLRWDTIDQEALPIPEKLYEKAMQQIAATQKN